MHTRLVLFDLDGTLVRSMELYAEKASELMNRYYRVEPSEGRELYLKTSGLPFLEQLNILFPDKGELNRKVAQHFENWKREIIKSLKLEREGVEVIDKLNSSGFITAVSSNNLQEYVEDIINRSGAKPHFVLGWDGKEFKKGEPHVSFLERETGIRREFFLMVGDSPNDLKLSKNCGIKFVALTSEFPPQAFKEIDSDVPTIENLTELLPVLLPSERPSAILPR